MELILTIEEKKEILITLKERLYNIKQVKKRTKKGEWDNEITLLTNLINKFKS